MGRSGRAGSVPRLAVTRAIDWIKMWL